MYNIFLLKEEKAHYKKNGRKFGAFPLLGVGGLEHTKKDTKVCDTHSMALIRAGQNTVLLDQFKAALYTHHTHTHTHTDIHTDTQNPKY